MPDINAEAAPVSMASAKLGRSTRHTLPAHRFKGINWGQTPINLTHSHEQLHHRHPQRHSYNLNRIERRVGAACFNPAQVCAKEAAAFGKDYLCVPLLQTVLAHPGIRLPRSSCFSVFLCGY